MVLIDRIAQRSAMRRLLPESAIEKRRLNRAVAPGPSVVPSTLSDPAMVVTAPVARSIWRMAMPSAAMFPSLRSPTKSLVPSALSAALLGPAKRAAAPMPSAEPWMRPAPAMVVTV